MAQVATTVKRLYSIPFNLSTTFTFRLTSLQLKLILFHIFQFHSRHWQWLCFFCCTYPHAICGRVRCGINTAVTVHGSSDYCRFAADFRVISHAFFLVPPSVNRNTARTVKEYNFVFSSLAYYISINHFNVSATYRIITLQLHRTLTISRTPCKQSSIEIQSNVLVSYPNNTSLSNHGYTSSWAPPPIFAHDTRGIPMLFLHRSI